jgi:hypothetical protein
MTVQTELVVKDLARSSMGAARLHIRFAPDASQAQHDVCA